MPNYMFYTDEGFTISPNNEDLESLQILGIESANSLQIALNKLFENNSWIKENNLNAEKIKYQIIINSQDLEHIKSLIDYLWVDEEKHFEETDDELKNAHIFNRLRSLKEAIS